MKSPLTNLQFLDLIAGMATVILTLGLVVIALQHRSPDIFYSNLVTMCFTWLLRGAAGGSLTNSGNGPNNS